MPIYEYQCAKCTAVHEVMQKFSDAPMKDCPACGGEVSKLMSRTSFALKGSGWYTTDYKRSSSSSSSSSVTSSAPKAEACATPASGGGCGSGNCD